MSMDKIRAILRTYTPGRRLRFKPEADAVREKVPAGAVEGLLLKVLPLPQYASSPLGDEGVEPPSMRLYALEIEIANAGGYDTVVLGVDDVEMDPFDLDRLRSELLHRTVNFPRSSGIGIAFPEGASDYGVIEDVQLADEGEDAMSRVTLSLRVAVDPAANPAGIDEFRTQADFTQCVLLLRRSSRDP